MKRRRVGSVALDNSRRRAEMQDEAYKLLREQARVDRRSIAGQIRWLVEREQARRSA